MAQTQESSESSTADLQVTLSQEPSDTPSVCITVKNTSPSTSYTVLKRDSPLDGLVLQLGLLSITPAGASEKFHVPRIMLKRIWPPLPQEFIVIKPGKSVTNTVSSFREPVVDISKLKEEGGGKASVQISGTWSSVWVGQFSNWEEVDDAAKLKGKFQSNALDIVVD